jgi:hypothetical protein
MEFLKAFSKFERFSLFQMLFPLAKLKISLNKFSLFGINSYSLLSCQEGFRKCYLTNFGR